MSCFACLLRGVRCAALAQVAEWGVQVSLYGGPKEPQYLIQYFIYVITKNTNVLNK